MIVLRGVEVFVGLDGGDDGLGEGAGFVDLVLVVFRFLPAGMRVENDAAVLGPLVISLTVEGGGVVGLPEYFQEFVVADLRWVVDDLAGFGVSGISFGDLVVGGVDDVSAAIAGVSL